MDPTMMAEVGQQAEGKAASVIGALSSIYGAWQSAKANKEQGKQVDRLEDNAESFFNNRVNRDFMDTNVVKGVVEQLRKRYLDQAKQIDSQTAATGGTAEANIAAKGKLNEGYGDAMSGIAQKGTAYQTMADNTYQNQISDIAKQRMLLSQQKAENATNLMESGANLMGTGADVAALGGDKNAVAPKPDITGLTDYRTKTTKRLGEDFFNQEFLDSLNGR